MSKNRTKEPRIGPAFSRRWLRRIGPTVAAAGNAKYSSHFSQSGDGNLEEVQQWQLPSWPVVVSMVVAYRLLDFGPGSRNLRLMTGRGHAPQAGMQNDETKFQRELLTCLQN